MNALGEEILRRESTRASPWPGVLELGKDLMMPIKHKYNAKNPFLAGTNKPGMNRASSLEPCRFKASAGNEWVSGTSKSTESPLPNKVSVREQLPLFPGWTEDAVRPERVAINTPPLF